MTELEQAIKDMVDMRHIHIQWAEYFEAHPEIEAAKVKTGEWDSAETHREIAARYDRVIGLLRGKL